MNIGSQIKNRRLELNMTQDELAEKLNVSRPAISNWETEKNYPDLQLIVMISDVLDISLDDLLKGDANVVEKIANDTREQRKLFGSKKWIIIRTSLLTAAAAIVLLIAGYWSAFVVESYIPYEDSGIRITGEGQLYVDKPYNGLHGPFSGLDKDGKQIEIIFLTSTFASRTWEKPIKSSVWDFGISDVYTTDEEGNMIPDPPVDKVYYLSEKYVNDNNLLQDRRKHNMLIPLEASEQEELELLEEIKDSSVLVWERK